MREELAQSVYIVHLPRWDKQQRSIKVFFYNRELSGPVSFDSQITSNADAFAFDELPRHESSVRQAAGTSQYTLIATDGELYGHHKSKRELFLKRLFTYSAREANVTVVSLERYLQLHPPAHEVKIKEYTSWSCHHGVARWETGCDCADGGGFQSFKASYQAHMRRLYETAYKLFEEHTRTAIPAYYEARNWYLSLRNGWLPEEHFWQVYGKDHKKPSDLSLVYKTLLLLEADYWLQRSHTSCGTYWAKIGIETSNNLRFARYAVSLIRLATGIDLSAYLTW